MFDSIQEGIVVIREEQLVFMNSLSNRLLSEMCQIKDFFLNMRPKKDSGSEGRKPIDKRIFWIFENNKQAQSIGRKNKKKSNSTSESVSKLGSDKVNSKVKFSLREISLMDTSELKKKIFTFESKLSGDDLTQMKDTNQVNTDRIINIIRSLKCMRGIDDTNIPTFRFFQFKKSKLRDSVTGKEQVMLCFSDISQKILYDTSKAEGELLSLINSTISHEMRNPLNSIIN